MAYKKIFLYIIIIFLIIGGSFLIKKYYETKPLIKVGILYSLSGPLSFSTKPAVDGLLLAIKEINKSGGVLGRTIQPIVVDGQSNIEVFKQQTKQLLTVEKVEAIFGCNTISEHNAISPIVEQYDNVLLYTGPCSMNLSPTTFCISLSPNQQVIPTTNWCLRNLGNSFFLVGSDTIFSRVTNTIITNIVNAYGAKVVGQAYSTENQTDFSKIAQQIRSQKPDIIINTITGTPNISFFKSLRSTGIRPENITTISFCIGEAEVKTIGIENMIGDYATSGYFQTVELDVNKTFIAQLEKEYGNNQLASDSCATAYSAMHLWKNSVEQAKSSDPRQVRKHLVLQPFYSPGGMIYTDLNNNHTWRFTRIGKVQKNGQFFIIWESEKAIMPQLYSLYFSEQDWKNINTHQHSDKDMQ